MGSSNNNVFIGLFICVSLAHITIFTSAKVYVVYMGGNDSDDPDEILMKNHQMLASVHSGSVEEAHASHLYTYKHGFRGFAAKLTDDQALQIAEMPGVVSVFENKIRRLHTTHSWDFIGLAGEETMEIPGFSTKDQVNVIIGFIDTGIWPESASFSDTDMPPVPAGWRGKCQSGEAFNITHCNRKLIGARYYLSGYEAEKQEKLENGEVEYNDDPKNKRSFQSPRDSNGHGTHTASTAAGRYVMDMNYKGLARGGARGGAPMARVAVYKTCWDSGCYDADILAAFDDAVRDGVHIVSLSLGPDAPQGDYFSDAISIGSFHAVSRGITVVSSVGNEGTKGAATNLAPWMITVAATSIDREFTANVVYCLESSLNYTKTRGKVLLCRHAERSSESKVTKSEIVKAAGGVGMILVDENVDVAIPFAIPAAIVGRKVGNRILSYINNTRRPTSQIFSSEAVLGSQPAPRVSSFSSKGPNGLTPEILKPDVAAPGLNILAAWSPAIGQMKYNILSGTSMACPHSGKPMRVDPEGRRGNAFDYGSGFVDPTTVLDPGLVYDATAIDYKAFLCSIGYDEKSLRLITRDQTTCENQPFTTPSSLNYPSIVVPNLKTRFSVTRTLTFVGNPEQRTVYEAVVAQPRGVEVDISPRRLVFDRYGQTMNFTASFKPTAPSLGYVFGYLQWKNGKSRVTTPLVVRIDPSDLGSGM
ncbi:Peptidase S8/S53 domain-containing protein [Cynara cardunculus var. scolymus]|uniref:Peptidase S8/S53 domain-containing protein n=1 Tax=Cynara cardunculus var. scolymus TaxID=59895 RepID=A0A103XJY9_CYNCS|nr:Peptidase S8/S53 domain-containing protein [Cynara cardunculus var. scolymus]